MSGFARTASGAWAAYYGGRCSICAKTFKAGTMVRWEGAKVVHEECDPVAIEEAEEMGPKERALYREKMCVKCFVVHGAGQEECQ